MSGLSCRTVRERLPQAESAADLEQHLAACPKCRGEAERYADLRSDLRALGAESASGAEQTAVRAAVLQRIAARPGVGRRLGWVAASVVATATLAGWLMLSRAVPVEELALSPPLPPRPPAAAFQPAPARPTPTPDAMRAPELESKPQIRVAAVIPADPATGQPEQVVLELASENPDVILYWLTDQTGD